MHSGSKFWHHAKPYLAELALAVGLALLFMVLSYVRLAGDATSAAFQNLVHDAVFAGPLWGTALASNIVKFILALALLHSVAALFCWLLALCSAYALPNVRATLRHWVLLWLCVCFGWVFVANAAFFPRSSLGEPYTHLVQAEVAGVSVITLFTFLVATAVCAVLVTAFFRWLRAHPCLKVHAAATTLGIATLAGAVALPVSPNKGAAPEKPHVILIGLDSLRYDSATSPTAYAPAPNVRRFLEQSTSFSNATTPLARTFPSWVSILTGRHPHTTGALINLLPPNLIETGDTLGEMFRRAGYHTVYSIDETRFSNIDASYGFDQVITPPIGASDFLIGWFGDTPLSNLVVNTRAGRLLFPYLHANRAAARTYDPDVFIDRLSRELKFDRPTFLAVHLTLAHWPFFWAHSPRQGTYQELYADVVARVDQQFADLVATLEKLGAFSNALVIVLSDHGEALGYPADTLVREGDELGNLLDNHKAPRGHGTDVLSPPQYHVVLGMRSFGEGPIQTAAGEVIDAPVSLEDIAPTLADLFSLTPKAPFDGYSLRPLLTGSADAVSRFAERVRFTESEFNPLGVLGSDDGQLSVSAVAAAAQFYRIDPQTDRITVRPERVHEVLAQRDYAAFRDDLLLAAIPSFKGTGYTLVAVDKAIPRSQVLTALPGPATYPEFQELYVALVERFRLGKRTSANGSGK